jgi:hypothetical protein
MASTRSVLLPLLGFDHGVGHPLRFLGDKKVHNYRNNKWCKELGNYSEWPKVGFDHGVGHPLLLLGDAKAPNCRKNKSFNDLDHYSEWPTR